MNTLSISARNTFNGDTEPVTLQKARMYKTAYSTTLERYVEILTVENDFGVYLFKCRYEDSTGAGHCCSFNAYNLSNPVL